MWVYSHFWFAMMFGRTPNKVLPREVAKSPASRNKSGCLNSNEATHDELMAHPEIGDRWAMLILQQQITCGGTLTEETLWQIPNVPEHVTTSLLQCNLIYFRTAVSSSNRWLLYRWLLYSSQRSSGTPSSSVSKRTLQTDEHSEHDSVYDEPPSLLGQDTMHDRLQECQLHCKQLEKQAAEYKSEASSHRMAKLAAQTHIVELKDRILYLEAQCKDGTQAVQDQKKEVEGQQHKVEKIRRAAEKMKTEGEQMKTEGTKPVSQVLFFWHSQLPIFFSFEFSCAQGHLWIQGKQWLPVQDV